jgi:hypothetical protein
MLFDLQSRGRRGAVKIIYTGLAILMGGGFILFGVGTGVGGGGIFDLFNNTGTSNTALVSTAEKQAVRATRLHPTDPAAWASLARARYQGADFDTTSGTFTSDGKVKLQSAAVAWQKYLQLNPAKPDATIARLMATAYSEQGLNEPADAASALEIVSSAQPTSANYGLLAHYAYVADEMRKGDLAAAKAVQLAPKAQQATVKTQLANVRKQVQQQQVQKALQQATTSTTTPAPAPAKTKKP